MNSSEIPDSIDWYTNFIWPHAPLLNTSKCKQAKKWTPSRFSPANQKMRAIKMCMLRTSVQKWILFKKEIHETVDFLWSRVYVHRVGRLRQGGQAESQTNGRTGGRPEAGRADGRTGGRTNGRADGRVRQYNNVNIFWTILNEGITIFIDLERFWTTVQRFS